MSSISTEDADTKAAPRRQGRRALVAPEVVQRLLVDEQMTLQEAAARLGMNYWTLLRTTQSLLSNYLAFTLPVYEE